MNRYDICIIGSGAGASPIAFELSKQGYKVVVLEKGPWFKTKDLTKDEIVATRRDVYTPRLINEPQVIEKKNDDGEWESKSNYKTGNSFWNGNMVGGSTNLMSGYFHRMKPQDFKLLSNYGAIEGANVIDWPIDYNELEPYYDKVEKVVGISGTIVNHSSLEPRSSDNFPYPPLAENIVSSWLDKSAEKLGYKAVPIPRAILSLPQGKRQSCFYSNYCGSFGCASDAKGSARVALLDKALETGNLNIIPNAKVYNLETNDVGKITKAWYHNLEGNNESIEADIFVVACQAVESSRLLLMSKSAYFPNGVANNNGLVGKNLIFSAGGLGTGTYRYDSLLEEDSNKLKVPGLFVNRSIQNWYEIDDKDVFSNRVKGGTVDFLFEHSNGISKANRNKKDDNGNLIFGSEVKANILD